MTSMVWLDPRFTSEACFGCGANVGDPCHAAGVDPSRATTQAVPCAKRIRAIVRAGNLSEADVGDYPYTAYLEALANGEPDAPRL
jgi:hypothetical protein